MVLQSNAAYIKAADHEPSGQGDSIALLKNRL